MSTYSGARIRLPVSVFRGGDDRIAMARYGALEVFKFGCYLSIPVLMTVFVAGNPGRLEAIIRNRAYVVYPPEGPRPPTAEELVDRINKNRGQ